MRTFSQKQNQPQKPVSSSLARPNLAISGPVNREHNIHPQRLIGNQAVQRILQTNAENEVGLASTASPHFAHDFGRIPVHPKSPAKIQAKLTVGAPGDRYEQEADHVAELVMNMAEPRLQRSCDCGGSCSDCGSKQKDPKLDLIQAKATQTGGAGTSVAPPAVHHALGSTGQPLESGTRSFFEPRFGHDFSQVRIHANQVAATAAKAVNALAFTVGSNIVFGAGRYQPQTQDGRSLLAHELTHVVQQEGDQQTIRRTCDCPAIGARPPDPAVPLEAGVSGAFPGLVSGDWCVLGPPTMGYNCYAWSIGDNTQWIDTQVDTQYGDNDGNLSFSDFDAYYEQTQGLHPQTAPNSDTMVALFASGGVPTHAALTANVQSCGTIPFTSKLGPGPLIAHDLYQLQGSTYGSVERYYG